MLGGTKDNSVGLVSEASLNLATLENDTQYDIISSRKDDSQSQHWRQHLSMKVDPLKKED